VLLAVVTVRVEEPDPPLIEAGLKLAFAPEGKLVALRATVPLNPFCAATVTVYVALLPGATLRELGVAEVVKSGVPPEDTVKLP
jgi:hypothetical protein